jgi:hypothetical protein
VSDNESTGCGYTGYDFGAVYPDSICIEGYLWDLDSCEVPGGPLFHGGDIACPECNHRQWLFDQREDIENEGWLAFEQGVEYKNNPLVAAALRYPADRWYIMVWWWDGWKMAKSYHQEKNEEEQTDGRE